MGKGNAVSELGEHDIKIQIAHAERYRGSDKMTCFRTNLFKPPILTID